MPAAGAIVEGLWAGRAGRDGSLRVFPDGCTDLTWDGERLRVVSSHTVVTVRLYRDRPSFGLRFRCGAAVAVLGPAVLVHGAIDLRELTGSRSVTALERDLRAACHDTGRRHDLLLRWVADRTTGHTSSRHPLATSIVESLAISTPPPTVALDHGLSARSLQREVRAATGLTPKALGRILRIRRFVTDSVPMLAGGQHRLADVAAELGYADQSHLGRECRAVVAATPASLVRSWRAAERGYPPL